MLLANKIPVFFNHQYFINGFIFEFDFLDLDGHEWKEKGLPIGFEKIFFGSNRLFFQNFLTSYNFRKWSFQILFTKEEYGVRCAI